MVRLLTAFLAVAVFSGVLCKPLDTKDFDQKVHHLWKRFINTAMTTGNFFDDNGLSKIRTRRNVEEDCEKLTLCKLHARSSGNFFAAYELYFVNKENAKLWDHQTHTIADCNRRFAHCFGNDAPAPAPAPSRNNYKAYRSDDYDYNY